VRAAVTDHLCRYINHAIFAGAQFGMRDCIHVGKWRRKLLEAAIRIGSAPHIDEAGGYVHISGEDLTGAGGGQTASVIKMSLRGVWNALHVLLVAHALIIGKGFSASVDLAMQAPPMYELWPVP